MIKIGFYINNQKIGKVDLSRPDMGNPGCGGTQYMAAILPYCLSQLKDQQIHCALFCCIDSVLPDGVEKIIAGDIFETLEKADQLGYDYLVYKPSQSDVSETIRVAELLDGSKLKVVAWLHLTPRDHALKVMAGQPNFASVVCVEHEQLDSIRDHPVFSKAAVIPNTLSLQPYKKFRPVVPFKSREKQVVYIGSLVSQKGFGRLARAWPSVISRVPDAELLVIGSGNLYNKNAQLGNWEVADEKFESSQIRPYLSGNDGLPHPSVKFLGILGNEKIDYLANARVGVVNPVGHTETFCISAIEFQAAGTPVIAGAYGGLFDTVDHQKTGYLVRSEKELADRIVELLINPQRAEEMANNGVKFVEARYNLDLVAQLWRRHFLRLTTGEGLEPTPPKAFISGLGQRAVRYNARIKAAFNNPLWWPSYLGVIEKVHKFKRKLIFIKRLFRSA